jgi:glycosyltransferase involved in cell wall biosynthesis
MLAPSDTPADAAPREAPRRLARVLHVLDLDASLKFGTLEEQMLLLARAFREEGGRFVPVFRRASADAETTARFEADGLPMAALDLGRFRAGTLRRLVGLVRQHRAEVVHWNFYPPLTQPYLWALTLAAPGLKHFYTDHNSRHSDRPAGRARLLKWPLARRYTRVLGVSDFVVDHLRPLRWPGLGRVRHFVNTERFRPDPEGRPALRQRLGAGDRFVGLVVAALIPDKGVDVAIRALAELPDRAVLWVAGDGPERTRLEALAAELGLGDRARFLGIRALVEPLMQAADCLVVPSTWHEAAGLVNIEGLACGLPLVATRIGGIPEIVDDGRTGLLFPRGDHRELARHLRRLMDEPELRRSLGEAARASAVAEFSPGRRVAEFLDLYRIAAPA